MNLVRSTLVLKSSSDSCLLNFLDDERPFIDYLEHVGVILLEFFGVKWSLSNNDSDLRRFLGASKQLHNSGSV